MANLVDEIPSNSHCQRAVSAARKYLQRGKRMGPSADVSIGEAFLALQWVYPREPFVILAGAKAYINSRDPKFIGDGVTRLKRALKPGNASNEPDRILLDRVRRYLDALSYLEAFKSLEAPHVLELKWKGPNVFKQLSETLDNIPQLLVLTEVSAKESREIEGAFRRCFFRADRVEDFVVESWGSLGYDVLRAYVELLKKVLEQPATSQNASLQDLYVKFWATPNTIGFASICLDSEFNDIKKCLFWIDEVVGTPKEPGVYRFYPQLYAGSPAQKRLTTVGLEQIAELEALMRVL